jgi:hypothetical protein
MITKIQREKICKKLGASMPPPGFPIDTIVLKDCEIIIKYLEKYKILDKKNQPNEDTLNNFLRFCLKSPLGMYAVKHNHKEWLKEIFNYYNNNREENWLMKGLCKPMSMQFLNSSAYKRLKYFNSSSDQKQVIKKYYYRSIDAVYAIIARNRQWNIYEKQSKYFAYNLNKMESMIDSKTRLYIRGTTYRARRVFDEIREEFYYGSDDSDDYY